MTPLWLIQRIPLDMMARSLLGFALLLVACSVDPVVAGSEVAAEVGCHSCHMDTASDLAPTLNGIWGTEVALEGGSSDLVNETYVRRSIVDPQVQIVDGYEDGRMPTFSLTDEEVDQLVEYIRSLS